MGRVEDIVYRRSNLREALLDRAGTLLEERGEAALSLRELAREVGVSHAAPARHFPDRQALLDAVALQGFEQLAAEIADAMAGDCDRLERLRATAHAYVRFAVGKVNLMGTMFRHDPDRDDAAIASSATAAFAPLVQLFAQPQEQIDQPGATQAATVFLATLHGIAALAACGVIARAGLDELIEAAVVRIAESDQTHRG